MTRSPETVAPTRPMDPADAPSPSPLTWPLKGPTGGLIVYLVGVTAIFGAAWFQLVADAIRGKALHAYAAAIPFICLWLFWQRRMDRPTAPGGTRRGWAVTAAAGAAVIGLASQYAWNVGAIPIVYSGSSTFSGGDVANLPSLVNKLRLPSRPFDAWLAEQLSPTTRVELATYRAQVPASMALRTNLLDDLNRMLLRPSVFEESRFAGITLRKGTQTLVAREPQGGGLELLNRMLIEDAYPLEIARNLTSWLAAQTLAWVLAVWAGLLWFVPFEYLRLHRFALLFLAFTIPFPGPLVNAVEIFLQTTSAWAVGLAFQIGDVPHIREGRYFWLPRLQFVVAQECSGIRSTLVLFITSILGGHLLLRSAWRQGILALSVIPLGIARNAFRICTITLLTVNVDPEIINSRLHHEGGPLFFAVALIPLFALLWWFRRQERPAPAPHRPPSATS